MPRRWLVSNPGFSLFETILAVLVLAIMSAVVLGANAHLADYDQCTQYTLLKSHLRYAQSRAVANNSPWGIHFQSVSVYWLFENSVLTRAVLPGEANDAVSLSALRINSAPQTVTFDGFGNPGAANIAVNTSAGPLSITANTGYIP